MAIASVALNGILLTLFIVFYATAVRVVLLTAVNNRLIQATHTAHTGVTLSLCALSGVGKVAHLWSCAAACLISMQNRIRRVGLWLFRRIRQSSASASISLHYSDADATHTVHTLHTDRSLHTAHSAHC